jgi:signal peptidase I
MIGRVSELEGPGTLSPPEKPGERHSRRLRQGLALVFAGALALLLVHALLLEVFVVGGSSMDPTLRETDRVVVVKVLGVRRGDLVVFKNPWDGGQNVIKRVVATEGERVAIKAGRVLVNGRELGEPYLTHPADHDATEDRAEEVLAPGRIFVLGDNRVASLDSRKFGPIETRLIVGRAVLALWPPRKL